MFASFSVSCLQANIAELSLPSKGVFHCYEQIRIVNKSFLGEIEKLKWEMRVVGCLVGLFR